MSRTIKLKRIKMKKSLIFVILCLGIFLSTKIYAQTQFTEYKFQGTINNNPIIITFLEPDHFYNYFQGNYYYTKYKKKIEFRGVDGVFDGHVKLTESVNGKNTGYFIFENLDYSKNKVVGKWYSMDGEKSYDVILTKTSK